MNEYERLKKLCMLEIWYIKWRGKRRGAASSDSDNSPSILGEMSAFSNVTMWGSIRRALTRPPPFSPLFSIVPEFWCINMSLEAPWKYPQSSCVSIKTVTAEGLQPSCFRGKVSFPATVFAAIANPLVLDFNWRKDVLKYVYKCLIYVQ